MDTKHLKAFCSLQLNQPLLWTALHITATPWIYHYQLFSVPSHQLREVSAERYTSCTLCPPTIFYRCTSPAHKLCYYGRKKGLHLVHHGLPMLLPPGMEIMKSFAPFNSYFHQQGPNHLPSHHPERFTQLLNCSSPYN